MLDDAEALDRLAAAVPANVRAVCKTLVDAGFEAVTVGGAVRDAILGRPPGDWDVATAALPDDVMRLFSRTVPTGIQHGTVTIVTGKGLESHVEVTTYRAEVGYTDSRRPDKVVFGVPLVDDLARRDLRANAIAYDPIHHRLIDPYNGRKDLADKVLRAVGASGDVYKDAVGRFSEDGLRVMRAVRFAAQLEMSLDAETERGIGPALPSLARVSKERISVELMKLLDARQPSRGLAAAVRTGIIALVLPDLDAGFDRWATAAPRRGGPSLGRERVIECWLARVDTAERDVRLAALLVELGDPDTQAERQDLEVLERAERLLKALKFSNADARTAAQLASIARGAQVELSPAQIRKLFAAVGRDLAPLALSLWRADAAASHAVIAEGERILRDGEPLSAKDLALTGKQLMDALSIPPSRVVGRLLEALTDRVIIDPTLNTSEKLVALAKQLRLELGADGAS